jgi:DNA-binding GntR family transcriptional regulator
MGEHEYRETGHRGRSGTMIESKVAEGDKPTVGSNGRSLGVEPNENSLVDRIAGEIHTGILSGEYAFGKPLRQAALAERFGVSRTPIREALRKLEAAGLIEVHPNVGAVVRGATPQAIRDAYQVRAELEGLAAELATSRITNEGLQELRVAEAEFRRAVRELATMVDGPHDDQDLATGAWVHANDLFHEVILRAAGNDRLRRTIADLHVLFPRSLTWATLSTRPDLLAENVEEHNRVLSAIDRQEPSAARMHMTYHVLRAGEAVARWVEVEPDPDADGARKPPQG